MPAEMQPDDRLDRDEAVIAVNEHRNDCFNAWKKIKNVRDKLENNDELNDDDINGIAEAADVIQGCLLHEREPVRIGEKHFVF